MSQIIIKPPVINNSDQRARMSCQICIPDREAVELWYEVESEYGKYLTPTSDAFVTAFLPYAMQHGLDVKVEGVMSEKLYFQLTSILIPMLAKYSAVFKQIRIFADKRTNIDHCAVPHAATGLSRGVDSFDAICQALKAEDSHKLTHLTFFNVGSHRSTTGNTAEQAGELFRKRLTLSEQAAAEIKLPVVAVDSNLGSLLTQKYIVIHHFCSFSAILALQKLFSSYYYASGYDLREFSVNKVDVCSAYYAPVLAQCLSTESTDFYISGMEKTRMDKVEYISKFPLTYPLLNVCYYEEMNCGRCEKCVRTQFELYALGKLELYRDSFDVDRFLKDKDKYMDFVLRHQNNSDFRDILLTMKRNNLKLSASQKLRKAVYRLFLKIKK